MAQPIVNAKIEELQFRIKTDPKSRLFFPLAEELRRNGRLPEAEQVLRTGLGVHATYLSAWVSLGRVLREQNKNTEAVSALTTAMQVDPGNVVAARLLADAYFDLGEKLEAIKKYKLVQALMPSDEDLEARIQQLDRDLNPPPPIAIAPLREEAAVSLSPSAGPEANPSHEAAAEPAAEPVADSDPWLAEESSAAAVPASVSQSEPEPVLEFAPQPEAATEPEHEPAAALQPLPQPEPAPVPESDLIAPQATTPLHDADDDAAASWLRSKEASSTRSDEALPDASAGDPAPDSSRVGSPFTSSSESVFDETSPVIHTIERPFDTDDEIPMSAQHVDSPFEEPSSYSVDALTIEHPGGIHIEQAPPIADVASVWADDVDESPNATRSSVSERESRDQDDDLGVTATMADLYVRQGLTEDARRIYEHLLQRDPGNEDLRAKLASLNAQGMPTGGAAEAETARATSRMEDDALHDMADEASPRNGKVVMLEQWLARVGRREPDGA